MSELYGTIIDVSTTNVGSNLAADAAAAATVLTVYDAAVFDELGGQLLLAGAVYSYTVVDPVANTVTVPSGLLASAVADDVVEVYPAAPVKLAMIDLGIPEGEAVQVVVPHNLVAVLADGMRAEADREVALVEDRGVGELYLKDVPGKPARIELAVLPDEVLDNATDGLPPASSPTPVVDGMLGALHVHWEALVNHDLVTYDIHVSASTGFTPDVTTLVASTKATSTTIRTLPTNLLLAHDTDYFVKIIASDSDGVAAASGQGVGQIMKATGADIAADYVYAGVISATQITGGEISGDVIIGGSLRTANTGARMEADAGGLTLYGPDGTPTTDLSTDGTSVFVGDAEIGGLTVKNAMSVRGTNNELSTGAELELAAGSTAGSTAPTVIQTWDSTTFTKAGDAGFLASNITSVSWVSPYWVCGYRDGTVYRVYRFDAAGAYHSLGGPPVTSSTASQTTQIVADGLCYTSASNGTLYRHAILDTNYSHIFTDDFPSSINTTNWPVRTNATWDSGSGGRAKITGEGRLDSPYDKNIIGAFVSARMVRSGATLDGQQMIMELYHTNDNEIASIYTEGTNLVFKSWDPIADVNLGSISITYNATTHAYWKISEKAGSIYYWTSADGVTWTQRFTLAHGLSSGDLDDTQIEFQSDLDGHPSQTVYIDEVRHGLNNDSLIVTYSRVNTSQTPTIGNDGTNLLVAEFNATNSTIRIQTVSPTTLLPTATVTSSVAGYYGPLSGVLKGNFDYGSSRWIVKAAGSGSWWAFDAAGAFRNQDSFLPDNGGSKGIGYDGSNFQGLGTDGKLYKHTGINPAHAETSFAYCAAFTWYDSNATGGTHETTISPVAAFTLKKRAKLTVTSPAIPPGGGTDDINCIRIYMGATAGALTLQSTTAAGVNTAIYTSLSTGGAAPPGSNNFPSTAPALIVNSDDSLVISGDGSITASETHFPDPVMGIIASTSTYTVTTTSTLIPGATLNITPPTLDAVYLVLGTVDYSSSGSAAATAFTEMYVDSTAQAARILYANVATVGRSTLAQQWIVSGLSVALHTLQLRANGTAGVTGYTINTVHTGIKIILLSY